jgi:chloramphenicol 3-O phosphotransferase
MNVISVPVDMASGINELQHLQSALRRVAKTHFEIVVDLVLRDTLALDECIAALCPRPTFVVGVWSPLEVLEERERARPDRAEGMVRSQYRHPAYKRPYAMSIDTSTCSPVEGTGSIRLFVERLFAAP